MNRKTLLAVLILMSFQLKSIAGPCSPDSSKTIIYIIGVNHTGTKYRTADSLLVLLRDIKPDLILSETDTLSGYFKKDYSLVHPSWQYKIARSLGLARKMAPEDEVIYPYLKEYPAVSVYPFDMAIPNRSKYVKKLIRDEQDWVDAVQKTYAKGNIPSAFESTYQSLVSLYVAYSSGIYEGTHRQLNRMELTDTLRLMMSQEKQLSKTLVDSVLALATFKGWQQTHYANWEKRNEIMACNIIRFAEKTNAKKVVVFTGLLHKYYLLDLLGEEKYRTKYVLTEYYLQ